MIAGITAFFTALPALIELLNRLGVLMEKLVSVAHQNNINKWISDLEGTIDDLEKAKTGEEKLNAAKKIVDIFHGLSPKQT